MVEGTEELAFAQKTEERRGAGARDDNRMSIKFKIIP